MSDLPDKCRLRNLRVLEILGLNAIHRSGERLIVQILSIRRDFQLVGVDRVVLQEQTCAIKRRVVPDRREHIQHFSLECGCHVDAVRCKNWKAKLPREREHRIVAGLLFADAMALQFDVHIVRAEGLNE